MQVCKVHTTACSLCSTGCFCAFPYSDSSSNSLLKTGINGSNCIHVFSGSGKYKDTKFFVCFIRQNKYNLVSHAISARYIARHAHLRLGVNLQVRRYGTENENDFEFRMDAYSIATLSKVYKLVPKCHKWLTGGRVLIDSTGKQ